MSEVMAAVANLPTNRPGDAIGYDNRERVREWMLAHVGGSNRECGEALGLSECTVGRHIKTLRKEWSQ